MSRQNAEAMRRAVDAWNRGDRDRWLDSVHPEIEWTSEIARRMEGSERVYRGHEGMLEYWDDWHAVWETTLDFPEIRDHGDIVLALGHVRAHGRVSGAEFDSPVAFVAEFDHDGLLVRLRAYLDHEEGVNAVAARESG